MIKLIPLVYEYISNSELKSVEDYVDKLFANIDIDVEFTKHFKDRMNDARNGKPITTDELISLFQKSYQKHSRNIGSLDPGMERVLKASFSHYCFRY